MITSKARAATALDDILDGVNNSGIAGTLRIYGGTPPSTLAASPGTVLATCTLVDGFFNAFGSADSSATPINAIGYVSGGKFAEDTSADASGTATYFRIYDWNNVAVYQGTVGVSGSGADLILSTTTIVATGLVTITSCDPTITGIY